MVDLSDLSIVFCKHLQYQRVMWSNQCHGYHPPVITISSVTVCLPFRTIGGASVDDIVFYPPIPDEVAQTSSILRNFWIEVAFPAASISFPHRFFRWEIHHKRSCRNGHQLIDFIKSWPMEGWYMNRI